MLTEADRASAFLSKKMFARAGGVIDSVKIFFLYTLCPKKNCGPELWR